MNDRFFRELLADHDIEIEPVVADGEVEPEIPPPPRKEYVIPPRIQTPHRENSDPQSFSIGAWDYHSSWWWHLALPWPRWPEPGAIATPEIEAEYDKEHHLVFEAQDVLWRYLWFVASKHKQPDFFEIGANNCEELANERLAWLKGVWSSRGMKCPDEQEFIAMATEAKPPTPSRGPAQGAGKDAEDIGSAGRTSPA
jgi:hypothetical protein